MRGDVPVRTSVMDGWIRNKHPEISFRTRKDLETYQLNQIQTLLTFVRKSSPFYRNLYDGLPLPDTLEAFTRYPVITTEDLLTHGTKMVCVSQREISRVVTLQTSGTTGSPKRIFFTEADQALTLDFFAYGMEEMAGPGDCAAICLPWKTPGCVGDLLIRGLESNNMHAVGIGWIQDLEKAAHTLETYGCRTAVGSPVQLLALLEYSKEHQIPCAIKTVLTSTDALPSSVRKRIQNLGVEVFDHLGMTECGLGAAMECRAHQGLHIRENDLYVEILDEAGNPVPNGIWGEITITTLTRKAMPFLRYRTGDFGRLLPDPCPCKSILQRLEVRGRKIESRYYGKTIAELDDFFFSFPSIWDYTLEEKEKSWHLHLFLRKPLEEEEQKRLATWAKPGRKPLILSTEDCHQFLPPYYGKRRIQTWNGKEKK